MHQAPLHRSRWRLEDLREEIAWLSDLSLPGIYKLLKRLDVVYKRGREYLHSPDPDYVQKLEAIARARTYVEQAPDRRVLVYQDEMTYYRRPSLSRAYEREGQHYPLARLGYKANNHRRIAGCLNVRTGHLFTWQRVRFDRHTLIRFYQGLELAYPDAEEIFLVQDNWPVHHHALIQAWLQRSRITVLFLPTYAPWTNPIEKVWLRLRQDVLHLHPFEDDWKATQRAVQAWLQQFEQGSLQLLHAVGLYPY